jgi:hypothetical protein
VTLDAALLGLIAWVLYPMWLAAGAADYLAHRRTDIPHTSGVSESLLHVAQLASIAVAFSAAVMLQMTTGAWLLVLGAVLVHSVLAYVDVAYTDTRRYISPFEQTVHGFLDVIPVVAVLLLGVLHWPQISAGELSIAAENSLADDLTDRLLLLSFAVLAGTPVIEELIRTLRARPDPARRQHAPLRASSFSSR